MSEPFEIASYSTSKSIPIKVLLDLGLRTPVRQNDLKMFHTVGNNTKNEMVTFHRSVFTNKEMMTKF